MITGTKMKRKILSLLLAAVMIPALPPVTSSAAQIGTFEVSGDIGYTYDSGVLTFVSPGTYTVTMSGDATATDKIAVNVPSSSESDPVDITIDNVVINVSNSFDACAFDIQSTSFVNLHIRGNNILTSGAGRAGLQVPEGATVNISAADSNDSAVLMATGGGRSAGIGGSGGTNGSNGAYHANAGSGTNGSAGGTCGNVAISSGHVIAIGGDGGVGIGGGGGGAGGRGGNGAYAGHGGIGGDGGSCENVIISGGFVTASSSNGGAGIGGGAGGAGGRGGDGAYAGNGKNGGNGGSCGNVIISGGTITSSSSAGDFGIGGGKAGAAGAGGSGAYKGSGGRAGISGSISSCVISGGSVKATVGGTPTDDQASPDEVYLTVITLLGSTETTVKELAVSPDYYGIHDMKTDADGKLYLYLPSGSEITTVRTVDREDVPTLRKYAGSVTTVDNHTGSGILSQTGFTVTGSLSGYDYETDTLTITQSGEYLLSMVENTLLTTNKIAVLDGVEADITLKNIRIDVSAISGACAFDIQGSATVNLTLSNDNTLISGTDRAGLQVPYGSTLNITGTYADRLTATGGDKGAGIGGGRYVSGGIITINGGVITAAGGSGASGIGGGGAEDNGNGGGTGGTVTLTDGVIFALGNEASDIGPGRDRVSGLEYDSLNISDSAAVFLKNDICTSISSITHQHFNITGHTTNSSIYGIPVEWAGDFGAYLRVYTLSYDLARGTTNPENPTEYAAGSNITLSNPTKPGYIFSGWSGTGITGTAVSVTITAGSTGNRSYTANWKIPSSSSNYNVTVPVNGSASGTLPVTINTGTGSVSIDASTQTSLLSRGKSIITVPPISGVDSYTLGILVPTLSTSANQGSLTVNTDLGSVTIPSNMLTGFSGEIGNKAKITISQGDKSALLEDVKAAIGNKPLIQLTLSVDGKQTDWSNPGAPVTVSIPYTPTAEELANPERIVIWYIDGTGNVVSIPNGHYDPVTGTVAFTTTHFSDYAVAYNPVSFSDVSAGAWYAPAVSFIAAREVTTGTGNGNFSPKSRLTRGEFIVLMMRAYGIAPDTNPTNNFSDAGSTYYTGYLAMAKRLKISAGIGNNMYSPGKEITRQEMFTLLYNTLNVIGQLPQGDSGETLGDFTDTGQISSWAKEAMKLLVETGTVGGSAGKLTPTGSTTRAEMAQVLYNLLGK